MLTCTVGRSQPHGSQSQPHEAREGLVVLQPPYVPMADALYAWRHVSSHTPGRDGFAFGKGHQTICQLEEGRIHRYRRLARPSRSLPISVAMRFGRVGKGNLSSVNASRDANGCIIQHTESARPPQRCRALHPLRTLWGAQDGRHHRQASALRCPLKARSSGRVSSGLRRGVGRSIAC